MLFLFFVLNLVNVNLYLINKELGLIFTLIAIPILLIKERKGFLNKFLMLIIFTSSFYGTSALLVFSYLELLLILYIVIGLVIIICNNYRMNMFLLYTTILSITFLIIGVILSLNPLETFINVLNLILFILVIFVTSILISNKKYEINIGNAINMYVAVCVSLSVGLIIQYLANFLLDIDLGQIFYNKGRTIFNLYFISKSTLSAFISSGAIIILIKMFKNVNSRHFLLLTILLWANIINTSRTGIIVLIITFILYAVFNVKHIFKNYKTFILIVAVLLIFFGSVELLLSNRTSDLIDDNGRFDIILQSKEVLKENLFFGIGSSWDDLHKYGLNIEIHNFILQYLLQMGAVVIISLLSLLIYILYRLKSSEFLYIVLFIYLVGCFYTYWHNSLFINPLIMIGIISAKEKYNYL